MPANAAFLSRHGEIEVAPNFALRREIERGLRRFDRLTSYELASLAFWGRHPFRTRLGDRWQANRSQWSSTRRALAKLRHDGLVSIAGRVGHAKLYQLAPPHRAASPVCQPASPGAAA